MLTGSLAKSLLWRRQPRLLLQSSLLSRHRNSLPCSRPLAGLLRQCFYLLEKQFLDVFHIYHLLARILGLTLYIRHAGGCPVSSGYATFNNRTKECSLEQIVIRASLIMAGSRVIFLSETLLMCASAFSRLSISF